MNNEKLNATDSVISLAESFKDWWTEYAPKLTGNEAKAAFIAALDVAIPSIEFTNAQSFIAFNAFDELRQDYYVFLNRRTIINNIELGDSITTGDNDKSSGFSLAFEIVDRIDEAQSVTKPTFNIITASEANKKLNAKLNSVDADVIQIILKHINTAIIEACEAGKNNCNVGNDWFGNCQPSCLQKLVLLKINHSVCKILTNNGYDVALTDNNVLMISW